MTLPAQENTLLVLIGPGMPPYSARGVSQSLEPIEQSSQAKRTVNAELIDLSAAQFRKYRSTITCKDQQAPAFDGVFPGLILTVHCVKELAVRHEADTENPTELPTDVDLGRLAVPGSVRQADGFIFYRPVLEMMVISCPQEVEEWEAEEGWSLELEEV